MNGLFLELWWVNSPNDILEPLEDFASDHEVFGKVDISALHTGHSPGEPSSRRIGCLFFLSPYVTVYSSRNRTGTEGGQQKLELMESRV